MTPFTISEWTQTHPRWPELVKYINAHKLQGRVIDQYGLVPTAGAIPICPKKSEEVRGFCRALPSVPS